MSEKSSDHIFAQELCNKDISAIADFQQENADELYFIASKFNNRGETGGSWTYHTKTGRPIKVSDSISDTYLWLIDQVFIKSCNYEGRNNATFRTYIFTCLNSKNTFIDWKRWKSPDSLIKYPKKSGYIPNAIRNLGEIYGEFFVMLSRNKSIGQISSALQLEELECLAIQNKIEVELIKDGKIHLLYQPRVEIFDSNPTEDEEGKVSGVQIQDEQFMQSDLSLEIIDVFNAIDGLISNLEKGRKRILNLYWTEGMNIDDIYDIMSNNSDYYDISIENRNDINKIINKSVYALFSSFQTVNTDLIEDYEINRKNWRNLIKVVFQNYNYKN